MGYRLKGQPSILLEWSRFSGNRSDIPKVTSNQGGNEHRNGMLRISRNRRKYSRIRFQTLFSKRIPKKSDSFKRIQSTIKSAEPGTLSSKQKVCVQRRRLTGEHVYVYG